KDQYVLFDDADFDKVKLESTKTISIDKFVDEADIDRLYWDEPFYVVPGKVAMGCLVLRGRERQLALEVRDNGLVAYTLRAHDEVRDAGDYFNEIPTVKTDKDMVEIAARIISQKQAAFDPSKFKDRYDDALREMITTKKKGQGLVDAPQPDETNVIDLMQALRNSLK